MKYPSPETILRISLNHFELGNSEMRELFGNISSSTISIYKKKARLLMIEKGVKAWNANHVNTSVAFEAWGIDVEDAERRYKRIQALNLQPPVDAVREGIRMEAHNEQV